MKMSDLISRSELLKAMNTWDKFGCDCHGGLVRIDNTNNEEYVPFVHYEDMVNCVKNMPTAYDVDKVVDELEKSKDKGSVTKTERLITKECVDKAIEIVKQGGVSDDVCRWKFEEETGFAWHCDNKCATYNLVYAKNLKIILDDFECKCPYCGKKIKVVE